jgi:hypothetical protein
MTRRLPQRPRKSRRLSGQWRDDDYDVLENGVVVGRILTVPVAPPDRAWMWASGHNGDIRHGVAGGAFSLQEGPDCGVADVGGS